MSERVVRHVLIGRIQKQGGQVVDRRVEIFPAVTWKSPERVARDQAEFWT